jgi:hypothetical protein
VSQLFGLIRASTDQLEKRLQDTERSAELARKENLYEKTCRTVEKHDRLIARRKLEKVWEKLAKSWSEIQKVVPDLPKASEIREPEQQIELLQEAWTHLATCTKKIQEKLQKV